MKRRILLTLHRYDLRLYRGVLRYASEHGWDLYWNQKTRPEAIKQDPCRDGCPDDVLAGQAEQYGLLFDREARPKPASFAVADALRGS